MMRKKLHAVCVKDSYYKVKYLLNKFFNLEMKCQHPLVSTLTN